MKRFAVVVPTERHAEHWNSEYTAMFLMINGEYHRANRTWKLPTGDEVCICVIRGVRDVDTMRGMNWTGFSREEIWDTDVVDSIRALIR
jgi:hypothetical protein